MSDVPRQSSPSTTTRPRPVLGSIRSETTPTRPTRASTLVLISCEGGWMCRSRKGRTPTSESSVPAAKLRTGARNPGTTSETTPASTHPTATLSSQNPGASISATHRSSAATSQTCHSCTVLEITAPAARQRPATFGGSGLSNTMGGCARNVFSPRPYDPSSPQEASMQASRLALPVIALGALLASPRPAVPQQPERHTIAGGNIAIYNLVGVMRVEGGSGSGVVVELTRGGLDAHADLRVALPVGKRVAVYLAVGRVFVSNVDGDLQVDVSAANVTVDHTKGSLHVDTGSGDVKVGDVEGDVSLDTGSGNVIVTGARGRQLKLDTGSGDVSAERVEVDVLKVATGSGNVTASGLKAPDANIDTGSGNVRLELLADAESLYVDTGSGDVTIEVPPQFGAHVDIETGSGGIELRGVSIRTTRLERDHVVGEIGDGKGRVKIETGSGGVTLQRRES